MNKNYELMQKFLDEIKGFAVSNPGRKIDENFIYSRLSFFNIQWTDANYLKLQGELSSKYKGKSSFEVINWKSFLVFNQGILQGNEVKLYIPLDSDHLVNGVSEILDFISKKNITIQAKVANRNRNDVFVIRVNSLEDANAIIDFVNSNDYVKEGMLKVNPFLTNNNGVGMTMDNNYSYNQEVTRAICDFLEHLRKYDRLDLFTVEELNKYIKGKISNVKDLDLKDIYILLSQVTTKDFKKEDFFAHAQNKLVDDYDGDRKRITDPSYYLEKAIKITEKYYPGNSKAGIKAYLNNNPNHFTRKGKARAGLIKYVSPADLINIMRTKLQSYNWPIPNNDNDLINSYLDAVLRGPQTTINYFTENKDSKPDNYVKDSTPNNYILEFSILKTAVINTLSVYNEEQAFSALKNLYLYSNPNYFTNKFNDRTRLTQIIEKNDIKKIILSNIDVDNLDINNATDVIIRVAQVILGDYKNKNKNNK